jgi:hypothetical protein
MSSVLLLRKVPPSLGKETGKKLVQESSSSMLILRALRN